MVVLVLIVIATRTVTVTGNGYVALMYPRDSSGSLGPTRTLLDFGDVEKIDGIPKRRV